MDQLKLICNKSRALRFMPLIVTFLMLLGWQYRATGQVSTVTSGWLLLIIATAMLIGDLVCSTALRQCISLHAFSARLLIGILVSNLILFLSAILLPFGLAINSMALLVIMLLLWMAARRMGLVLAFDRPHVSEQILFPLAAVAVTIWCWDTLRPIEITGNGAVIRAWQDIYYHLSQISSFGYSRGASTLFDVQMAGAPMQPYHMASYILAAAMFDATGISSYAVYASLMLPLGLFATVLGAYMLGEVAFGKWPALAGALALILLPDAAQQGFGNPFLGYYWLQLIAPSLMYGVASAAVVFACLLEASRSGRLAPMLFGYFFVLVTLLYKAQIFVAISLLALLLPLLFLQGRLSRYRFPLLVAAVVIYFGAAAISQLSTSVPTLRLDGSGLGPYFGAILSHQDDGLLNQVFKGLLGAAGQSWPLKALVFSLLLLVCTFGVYLPAYLVMLRRPWTGASRLARVFPLLVVAVYLVMATCLALDERRVGTMEELLHRPFVWAYFVVVVFFGATLYARTFGDAPPVWRSARIALLCTVLLLAVPAHFGQRIQTFKTWQTSYPVMPACLVEVARYIEMHSQPGDVVQDSLNDPQYRFTGLSQRRPYALDSGGVRLPAGIHARLDELARIKAIESGPEVVAAMRATGIRWYVVNPDDPVKWVAAMRDQKAHECGGYLVFRF
ncbi:hypothetical protein OII53_17800 [Achromobacter ruhlandii]|uniref:hypothetical protein n=1 Tax=Achromobacter ruhlandii TaxID=72557 RepID=UPI0012FE5623|nr:hypothetical protein [Achromobacter ruhlandii]MCV6797949.1 hypothetical protein [Achromobacter ruhlandii]MCV6802567.1 hypothetical protein [Achromobacter ruhlandii]MCV6810269.1 hypothetical protein [Achromobacter ruhlandii]MCV6820402.1 hypothetical protein [Achromobacter ruhlandii]MCZ8396291.1 hypothetical protein [Achromobacter ruhlandii]